MQDSFDDLRLEKWKSTW